MASDRQLNERDSKLVQWLNEAHVKEAELEAQLGAHINLTHKQSYRKRLQQHLKETREHKRLVRSRIKALGGEATTAPPLPGVPEVLGETAGKAMAAVKTQVGAARAAVTAQPETHLRNAQDELREEHVEIALYTRLETLAQAVGDRDTAQLARRIRRDEERMAKYLDAELRRLVKDVVRSEVPRDQRATATRRRTTSRTAASSRSTRRSPARSGGSRSTAAASQSSGRRGASQSSRRTRARAAAGGGRSR